MEILDLHGQKNRPVDYVYCGRKMTMGGWNLEGSLFANPFVVGHHVDSVEEAVIKYYHYLEGKEPRPSDTPDYIGTPEQVHKQLPSLVGRKLGCWCKERCHCQVLMFLIEGRPDLASFLSKSQIKPKPRVDPDLVHGMLLGLAIGDAIGLPFEFHYDKQEYSDLIQYQAYSQNRQGRRDYGVGQFSDDTEMTMVLARSLIVKQGWHRDTVLLGYMEWANSNPPMGKNTRNLFQGVKTVRGYQARFDKFMSTEDIRQGSQSNGCLMRCSPIACLWNTEIIEQDTMLTNPSDVAVSAATFYTHLLRMILTGQSKKECWLFAKEALPFLHVEIQRVVDAVESRTEWDLSEKGRKGWVIFGLYAGLYSYYHFSTLEETYRWVIKDHPYSDTDTNAAIAGCLVGASLGFRAINDGVMKHNISLVMNYGETDRPRPEKYHLKDLHDVVAGLTELSGL